MSIELKLTAETPMERRFLEYLTANASEALAEKINGGRKTLAGAVQYCTAEARKLAAGAGCETVKGNTGREAW